MPSCERRLQDVHGHAWGSRRTGVDARSASTRIAVALTSAYRGVQVQDSGEATARELLAGLQQPAVRGALSGALLGGDDPSNPVPQRRARLQTHAVAAIANAVKICQNVDDVEPVLAALVAEGKEKTAAKEEALEETERVLRLGARLATETAKPAPDPRLRMSTARTQLSRVLVVAAQELLSVDDPSLAGPLALSWDALGAKLVASSAATN